MSGGPEFSQVPDGVPVCRWCLTRLPVEPPACDHDEE